MCPNTDCSAHRQPPPSRDPLLPLLIDGLNAFLAGVVGLILIFRRHFLGYTVEFVMIFLLILTLLFFFIHLITSWIVCALPLLLCMPSPGFMGQNSPSDLKGIPIGNSGFVQTGFQPFVRCHHRHVLTPVYGLPGRGRNHCVHGCEIMY